MNICYEQFYARLLAFHTESISLNDTEMNTSAKGMIDLFR